MKLYCKDNITSALESMSRSGRFVHSYIITGEKGTGKKASAQHIAMHLLCDEHSACGKCRQCRRILSGQHPDFITVKKSGRIYSVDDIRENVVADCLVRPNDCDRKIYFLPDCEGWTDRSQNALLKTIEEPPDHAYFILTAVNCKSFLNTIISRSMVLEVHEADRESCMSALRDTGDYTEEQIEKAVRLFNGNIGKCIDYLNGDKLLEAASEAVTKAVDAIVSGDEYSLAVIFNSISSNRDEMRYMLEMLARCIRDAAAVRTGTGGTLGCTESGSARMAERISSAKLLEMYDAVCDASDSCMKNANSTAAAAVLAGTALPITDIYA